MGTPCPCRFVLPLSDSRASLVHTFLPFTCRLSTFTLIDTLYPFFLPVLVVRNGRLILSSIQTSHHGQSPPPQNDKPLAGYSIQQCIHQAPEDGNAVVSVPNLGGQGAVYQATSSGLNVLDQQFQGGYFIQEPRHANAPQATHNETERRRRRRRHQKCQDEHLLGVGSQFGPKTRTSRMPVQDQGMMNDLNRLGQRQPAEEHGPWAGPVDEEALQQQARDTTGHLLLGVGSHLQ